jgi:GNAT superfamily N-acetyltransferase
MTVEVAKEDDRTALGRLRTALGRLRTAWTTEVHAIVDDPGFARRFSSWMDAQRGRRTFWIARDAGRPVGMVNLLVIERMPRQGGPSGGWGYLGNLFVLPDHRRSGVGRRLVEAVLADAAIQGLERVMVHPNERSLPFWRHSAFSEAADLFVWPA